MHYRAMPKWKQSALESLWTLKQALGMVFDFKMLLSVFTPDLTVVNAALPRTWTLMEQIWSSGCTNDWRRGIAPSRERLIPSRSEQRDGGSTRRLVRQSESGGIAKAGRHGYCLKWT